MVGRRHPDRIRPTLSDAGWHLANAPDSRRVRNYKILIHTPNRNWLGITPQLDSAQWGSLVSFVIHTMIIAYETIKRATNSLVSC
jgi:hypothetical protein